MQPMERAPLVRRHRRQHRRKRRNPKKRKRRRQGTIRIRTRPEEVGRPPRETPPKPRRRSPEDRKAAKAERETGSPPAHRLEGSSQDERVKVSKEDASGLLRLQWAEHTRERDEFCYLCSRWATPAHLKSKGHAKAIRKRGASPRQDAGPPVLSANMHGRLVSEVINEWSEAQETTITEDEKDVYA